MSRFRLFAVLAALCSLVGSADAHPAPFSYVDVRLAGGRVDLSVVAHIFDLAHDLSVDPMDRLLDPAEATARHGSLTQLLQPRFSLTLNGATSACAPTDAVEVVPERQSVKLTWHCAAPGPIGTLALRAVMFPYDPQHETFVNIYEAERLTTQAILDQGHPSLDYYAGTRQGVTAVVARFLPSGIHHILIGPDHLLFLVGLLLLGGRIRQLLVVVTAFTVAHSLTLSLAALNILTPPARLIEPTIALSIVYVGADNLLVRNGRDVRAWIAFFFGFIHGFGFANVLREMDLPSRALGWSLFSFNVGVEIGQLAVVVVVASALAWVRSRSAAAGERLAFIGSLVVIAAGAFWFVQRVFFPGGMA